MSIPEVSQNKIFLILMLLLLFMLLLLNIIILYVWTDITIFS